MSSSADLSGNLKFLGLVDLIQLLGSNGSSGILKVQSKYASGPGIVFFENGNPIDAACASMKGLEALFALFGWTDGGFEFVRDTVARNKVIKNSRMEIILDGLKRLDDGKIEKLGPEAMVKTVADAAGGPSLPLVKGPLIDYNYVVDEEEYYDGSKIVEEGKHGNWIWVILEGVVDIVKETPQGPLTIVKVGPGAFVGSMASFLLEGHMRSASAIASGKVQLGVLDSQRVSSEYARMSSDFKGVLRTLENRLNEVSNRIVDFHLKKNRLNDFVKNRKLTIKQGSKEEKLYVIKKGSAYTVRSIESVHSPLTVLRQDDYFGNFPFADMGHEPFSASVYGSEDLETSELDLESLQKEYDQLSPTIKHIIENMAMSISVTTMLVCNLHKNDKKQGK